MYCGRVVLLEGEGPQGIAKRTENVVVTFLDAIVGGQKLIAGSRSGEGPMGGSEGAARDAALS